MTRRSTDVQALGDPDVSAAVRFIREHACEGMSVKDLLAAVPLSRRVLEGRFRKLLGHTPHDEIARVRFERVRQLLRETRLPLTEVARRSGFRNAEYLSTAFRRTFGTAAQRLPRGRRADLRRVSVTLDCGCSPDSCGFRTAQHCVWPNGTRHIRRARRRPSVNILLPPLPPRSSPVAARPSTPSAAGSGTLASASL